MQVVVTVMSASGVRLPVNGIRGNQSSFSIATAATDRPVLYTTVKQVAAVGSSSFVNAEGLVASNPNRSLVTLALSADASAEIFRGAVYSPP